MSNKPGYKHTPLGLIPHEWDAVKLKEICTVNQGLQIPIEQRLKEPTNGAKFYITIQYLNNGKKAEYIINAPQSVCCKVDDILMTRTGNTGIVISGVNGVFHNNFFKINYNREKVDRRFLIEYLESHKTQHTILVKAGTSTIPDLNHKDFYSIFFPLPSLNEQRKIATILSTWDEAITKTQQIISQQQLRNIGLMQQLLTGKKRLKGFKRDWRNVTIGNILIESRIPSKDSKSSKRITVRLNQKGLEQRGVRGTESEDATNYFVRKKGQFIYGKQNLHKGAFGIIPDFLDEFESSQDIPAFDFRDGFHPKFFVYYLGQGNIYPALEKYATGTGSKRIHPEKLFKVHFDFPDLEEQKAIVNVLDAAVIEMKLYEQELAVLQQQKKGLMQKLLTGKVRVKL
jgi:type I restriction enzyme, S subunit